MDKFTQVRKGYDPEEVNAYFDKVINQVELLVKELKQKNERIKQLEQYEQENKVLKERIEQYIRNETNLNNTIILAQRTSDQIKVSAQQEKDILLDDARKSASRIVNEALMRAEKIEYDTKRLQKNVDLFKKRLKDIIETQLSLVEEIDKEEL